MLATLYALDCYVNGLTGGRYDMTISARIGGSLERGCACRFARVLAYVLDAIEHDHCRASWHHYRNTRGMQL